MRKSLIISVSLASLAILSSCSGNLGALDASNFNVTPNPLVAQGGDVAFTIDGTFPEKYMKKRASVVVTPELRYNGEKTALASKMFQGEKARLNGETVYYKVGGKYTMRESTPYKDAMQKSDLYLTFKAMVGKKEVFIPEVKIAEGVIATSELYKKTLAADGTILAKDTFQRINEKKQESEIKFLINQANLRKSELKGQSVKEFVSMLQKINKERETLALKNIEMQAYASPEGGEKFNDKLAGKRQQTTDKYLADLLKKQNMKAETLSGYTAQDWDGFQRLVSESNLQDKDVILRVLSMYQDPQEREQQIRNMSAGFKELATGILPELRRSRMIINYETIGRSDEQIKEQYNADSKQLSTDETLYMAALTQDKAKKEEIYRTAANNYPEDWRAWSNIADLEMQKGNYREAAQALEKALQQCPDAQEANANKGLLALLQGDRQEAERYIAKGTGKTDISRALGALALAKGNYKEAADVLKGDGNTAALAEILSGDLTKAESTLSNAKQKAGITDYLMAIIKARQGDKAAAKVLQEQAIAKDPTLKAWAEQDLEF